MSLSREWVKPLALLFLTPSLYALDAERPFLNNLGKEMVTFQDFDYPFLFSVQAINTKISAKDLKDRVSKQLKRVEVKVACKNDQCTVTLPPEPSEVLSQQQNEAVTDCTLSKCLVKLNNQTEKPLIEKAPKGERQNIFNKLIAQRIQAFAERRFLLGYEDRKEDNSSFEKMLEGLPYLSKLYPRFFSFLKDGLWKKESLPGQNWYRQELVQIAPDRLQPILRFGSVYTGEENGAFLFAEVHLYSNHYFDASMRMTEVIPNKEGSTLVLTDVLEIDELTKSGLIRLLYMGKMKDAVAVGEKEEMDRFLE